MIKIGDKVIVTTDYLDDSLKTENVIGRVIAYRKKVKWLSQRTVEQYAVEVEGPIYWREENELTKLEG